VTSRRRRRQRLPVLYDLALLALAESRDTPLLRLPGPRSARVIAATPLSLATPAAATTLVLLALVLPALLTLPGEPDQDRPTGVTWTMLLPAIDTPLRHGSRVVDVAARARHRAAAQTTRLAPTVLADASGPTVSAHPRWRRQPRAPWRATPRPLPRHVGATPHTRPARSRPPVVDVTGPWRPCQEYRCPRTEEPAYVADQGDIAMGRWTRRRRTPHGAPPWRSTIDVSLVGIAVPPWRTRATSRARRTRVETTYPPRPCPRGSWPHRAS
jgi:hypothetical protein